MRICVFGVGALGGLIAARLQMAGVDVWLFDTESVMDRLRTDGLSYTDEDGCNHSLQGLQFADPQHGTRQFDYIILALKAHQISAGLPNLTAMMNNGTVLVTMQNGIPWWYFQRHAGAFENRVLHSVDPGAAITRNLDAGQVIGCVAYPAAEKTGPGVVRHVEGSRLSFGELDGTRSPRCQALAGILRQAGFRARMSTRIRNETWLKALGNLSFNPISALTRMTMQQICETEPARRLVIEMMHEAEQVAISLDIDLQISVKQRMAGAADVGHHKTSMLQDLEAGRQMEIDALLGSIVEIGVFTGTPTPTMKVVYDLAKSLDSYRRIDRLIDL